MSSKVICNCAKKCFYIFSKEGEIICPHGTPHITNEFYFNCTSPMCKCCFHGDTKCEPIDNQLLLFEGV